MSICEGLSSAYYTCFNVFYGGICCTSVLKDTKGLNAAQAVSVLNDYVKIKLAVHYSLYLSVNICAFILPMKLP